MRRISAPGMVLLLVACAAAEPRGLLDGVERRELPNGLSVAAVEDRRLPTVTALLIYRVGSADEETGRTGTSHFFEHMVFKGTRTYPKGEIDRLTYRWGGENNAFTTRDVTGYWFRVGADHLDEVLAVLADTMENCVIDPAEFELERKTVLQEMDRWLDGPWGALYRELESAVYGTGAYGHPVMGRRSDVESLTRDQMEAFYRAAYGPRNASLVIVGDVDRDAAFGSAERAFAKVAGRKIARRDSPPAAGRRTREVTVPTTRVTDRFILAWRTEPAGTDTDFELDLISTLLGEGRSSRLGRQLVDEEGLAAEGNVDVLNASRLREGLFSVRVELALGAEVDDVRRRVLGELDRLKREPVGARELRRAKNLRRSRFVFEAESQVEFAVSIGYYDALGVPDYVATYLDRIEAITPERIMACARRVFRGDNRTAAVGRARRLPRGPKTTGEAAFGAVREARLENGLTVLAQRRSELPVVAIRAFVRAGSLVEPREKAGVARLTGDLLDEGSRDVDGGFRSGADLASEIEFVGGRFSTGSTGVSVQVLSEHAALALDRVADVLRRPTFPMDRFRGLRRDLVAELGAAGDDPAWTARRLFRAAAFGDHPHGRPGSGTVATARRLIRADVVSHYRRFFRPENVVIAVAGDLEPDRAIQMIRTRFRDWRGRGEWEAPRVPGVVGSGAALRIERPHPSNQVRIHMGHPGVARNHPDYAALRVMETILFAGPGLSSRLAREVRDSRGLAYDVYGTLTLGAGEAAGPFQIVMGVAPGKEGEAVKVAQDVIREFRKTGPTEKELDDARRYLTASFPTSWETAADRASYMLRVHRYNLGAGYDRAYREALGSVTRETVRRAARVHLDPEAMTVVMVGPLGPPENPKEGDSQK